jgi:hypothetical protein
VGESGIESPFNGASVGTIEEYGSGQILRSIWLAHLAIRAAGSPLIGSIITGKMEERMKSFAICPVSLEDAGTIIEGCKCCAAGPRVCQPLFPASPASESVFLDGLAERMIIAEKARMVTREEALSVLARYPDHPLLISKVSGQYLEICRSEPSVCIYWKMRRSRMKMGDFSPKAPG